MTIKTTLDNNGIPTAFFNTKVHEKTRIPAAAITITKTQYQEFLLYPGRRRWDYVNSRVIAYAPPFNLTDAIKAKQADIRAAFNAVKNAPVTVNAVAYNGGYDSGIKIDAAKRMAQMAGLAEVTIFDLANTPQVLSIADAEALILTIGANYQTKFAKKQALLVQAEAATTEAELNAIIVEV